MELVWDPVEWDLVYPVYPTDPIGRVRRDGAHWRAWLRAENLGVYCSGNEAATAAWERYLDGVRAEHDIASRMHGSRDRSGRQR